MSSSQYILRTWENGRAECFPIPHILKEMLRGIFCRYNALTEI